MTAPRLADLQALQGPDGAFVSVVESPRGSTSDVNGFVAAMVLRLLRHHEATPAWVAIRDPALAWLRRCESRELPGAFAFWPDGARPPWAPAMPADADDTAIILVELLRLGRAGRDEALRSVCTTLVPARARPASDEPRPPWLEPGAFLTWLPPRADRARPRRPAPNVVDCCVNANVLALLSLLDARHLPGYRAAAQTIQQGVLWAGRDPRRLAALTPFYTAPSSLADALEHAVECGAEVLLPAWRQLAALPPALLDAGAGACRSAYGSTTWHAPVLALARAIGQSCSSS